MKNGQFLLLLLAFTGLLIQAVGAEIPGGDDRGLIATDRDFNVSGIDAANSSIPVQFQSSPEPLRVEVTVSDTLIPGPKGEMQAGPRAIGISLDPVFLILAALLLAGAAGIWYLARKKPVEQEENDEK